MDDERASYRRLIDALVGACEGQGQVAAGRVIAGIWNGNAEDPTLDIPDERAMNDVLGRLSAEDRQVLAKMMAGEFVGGVHETLEVLHVHRVPPFDRAYEGTPFHDFIGRLDGWEWPEE